MKPLNNRSILVTGAGDGIGRAASIAFAEQGASVILLGRSVAKLEHVYDEILAAGGPQPAIYPLDLEGAKATDYQDMAKHIETQMGGLDGILHNAAELGVLCPIALYPPHIWAQVFMVNVHGPMLLSQACLPLLKQSANATLVFTTDRHASQGKAYWGAYGASKAAIETLAHTLADELENTTVRVNLIDPGPCRTGLRVKAYPGAQASDFPSPESLMPRYLALMEARSVAQPLSSV